MSAEPLLSRRERQILDILHAEGKATAARVHELLFPPPSYSAVRAFLRILEEKGHAKHERDGARYVYSATQARSQASRSALRRVLATFFGGSVEKAVAALLEVSDTRLSQAELQKLQAIINKAGKEGR
jgi:predicted transcriptional regulator